MAVIAPTPYRWTKTSKAFRMILGQFIARDHHILEIGSSTGHISFHLAQEGYRVTLLDIRRDVIDRARQTFEVHGLKAQFFHEDIFAHRLNYDFAWNSGLIQCFKEEDRMRFLRHAAKLTRRLLLFYPDTDNPAKRVGANGHETPGVGDAREYSARTVPVAFSSVFGRVHFGRLPGSTVDMPFDMFWLYGQN
jgi:SAM-dependent methyltransferase